MRLSFLSATCPHVLALLLLLGCSQSSSDVTFGTPLDGTLSDTSPDASGSDGGSDANQPMLDSQVADLGMLDTQMEDGGMPDAILTLDAEADDASVADMGVVTTADSMLPPASCVGRSDRTCEDICQSLTLCLASDGCLGIDNNDAQSLRASCVDTCGFNTATRTILCSAEDNECAPLLDALYESDTTLNALCNFDDAFTEAQHDACRSICSHTNLCLGDSGDNTEPPQACRFQCLSSGSYATADCVTLCSSLSLCEPNGAAVLGSDDQAGCVDRCGTELVTPQAIACVGLDGCSADAASMARCVMDNSESPSCALSCQRILECSESENPFGVTEANLAACVGQCLTSTTAAQRQCSFDTACDESFVENFNNCGSE